MCNNHLLGCFLVFWAILLHAFGVRMLLTCHAEVCSRSRLSTPGCLMRGPVFAFHAFTVCLLTLRQSRSTNCPRSTTSYAGDSTVTRALAVLVAMSCMSDTRWTALSSEKCQEGLRARNTVVPRRGLCRTRQHSGCTRRPSHPLSPGANCPYHANHLDPPMYLY